MKRFILSLSTLLGCSLLLSACEGPGAMPRGYIHHMERYKSPAPGLPSKISDDARASMTADQAKQMRRAVHEVAMALTDRAGLAPRPVYVQTADPLPPFYAMMDNDVRDVMAHIGYRLSDMAEGAYIVQYDAQPIDLPGAIKDDQQTHQRPNVTLTLRIIDGPGREGKVLTTQSGDFFIQGAEDLDIPHAHFSIVQKAGE